MSISFNKREVQSYCYGLCSPIANGKIDFSGLHINSQQASDILTAAYHDGTSFYYNAVVSYASACALLVNNKATSWPSVELYYSVFYSLKSILSFNGYSFIRDSKWLYFLQAKDGESPKRALINNDHKAVFAHYEALFRFGDYLLTNDIGGVQKFYEWITDLREISNYRQKVFLEPNSLPIFSYILNDLHNGLKIGDIITNLEQDTSISCFQENTAWLISPLHKIREAHNLMKNKGEILSADQISFIDNILKSTGMGNLTPSLI